MMQVKTLYEQLFFVTAFIEAQLPGGETSRGTGFFYIVKVEDGSEVTVLVTNKHVVANATSVSARVIAGEDANFSAPKLGEFQTLISTNPAVDFVGHPDNEMDVCVVAVGPAIAKLHSDGHFTYYKSIAAGTAFDDEEDSVDAVEAITFVGYPIGLFDQKNYLPIARRGHTATPPSVDYNGKPIFLVDASVFPGSSGSPVLIAESGAYMKRGEGVQFGERVMFMGILAAVYSQDVPVLEIPTGMKAIVEDTVNIGIVFKARVIDETVDIFLAKHGLQRGAAASPSEVITDAEPEQDALVDEQAVPVDQHEPD